jgi:hypothetical protein
MRKMWAAVRNSSTVNCALYKQYSIYMYLLIYGKLKGQNTEDIVIRNILLKIGDLWYLCYLLLLMHCFFNHG